MPESNVQRNERRASRYNHLLSLGYSPREARTRRDRGITRVDTETATIERRIARVPVARRTESQSERLSSIRSVRRETRRDPIRTGDFETRATRVANFSQWSGASQFPSNIRRLIERFNLDAGFDPLDAYGYRIFFHRYVNQVSEIEARQRVETRDT